MKKTSNQNFVFSFVVCLMLFSWPLQAQSNRFAQSAGRRPTRAAVETLEKEIPRLMKLAEVPGLAAALIRDGRLVWSKGFGVRNAETNEPVTNETVFEAASLSKVVFAYAVLKLVDQGRLDLDRPLNRYLGNNYDVGDDARIDLITARRVLSHTSGFPNWRRNDSKTLPINFTPGEKFSYSGEGFVYLAKAVEKITGLAPEDFVQKSVLQPLGMTNSSFVWQERYKSAAVFRHDWRGLKAFRNEGKDFNAAASLRTTADDYARFVVALLKGEGLKKRTWLAMLAPQVRVGEKSPQVFWGLGVGLETTEEGKSFWHWGDQGNSKAYVTAFLPKKDAVVFFANATNGLSFTNEILSAAIGGRHPGIDWLNYERFDSPARTLLKEILAQGAAASLEKYRQERTQNAAATLTEAQMNTLGYRLLEIKKTDDAIEVFRQNTDDFPNSANTWDSLAEAYMKKGDKNLAIEYYEKSLKLDPNNKNAVEQLKKLKL